jgi:integrase/recombinase XerD
MNPQILQRPAYKKLLCIMTQHLQAKGYQPKTICMCRSILPEILHFLENRHFKKWRALNHLHVQAYLHYIENRKRFRGHGKLSEVSVKHHMYVFRLLLDHLIDTRQLCALPVNITAFYPPRLKTRTLPTPAQVHELIMASQIPLDQIIMALAYGCALRRSEITAIEIRDFYPENSELLVRQGKNGRARIIPIAIPIWKIIQNYLVHTEPIRQLHLENKALLIKDNGERISGHYIYTSFKRLVKRCPNIHEHYPHLTLHDMRRAMATHLFDQGADADFVKRFLGHSQIDTTHIYARNRKLKSKVLRLIANQ